MNDTPVIVTRYSDPPNFFPGLQEQVDSSLKRDKLSSTAVAAALIAKGVSDAQARAYIASAPSLQEGLVDMGLSNPAYVPPTALRDLVLSNRKITENTTSGVVIGTVTNFSLQGNITLQSTIGNRFAYDPVTRNLKTGVVPIDYETAAFYDVVFVETTPSGQTHNTTIRIDVLNVYEQPNLQALTLSAASVIKDQYALLNILGARPGSVITGNVPDGMTLDSASRTISGIPTTASNVTYDLTETLGDSQNSPRVSTVALEVALATPSPIITSDALRGGTMTATGTSGLPVLWQARTSPGAAWTDTTLTNPFTIGNGSNGTGMVGRDYQATVTYKGITYTSPVIGPTGVTNKYAGNAFIYTVGQTKMAINDPGKAASYNLVRDTDYRMSIRSYADNLITDARMEYFLKGGVGGAGEVFTYMHFANNAYTSDPTPTAFSPSIAHSNLGPVPLNWNLTQEGTKMVSYLTEYFPSDTANDATDTHRTGEIGFLPIVSPGARAYFMSSTGTDGGTYVDENGLSWLVRIMPGPTIIQAGAKYIVCIPPDTDRMSGNFRFDRYLNWLLAKGLIKGSHYIYGLGQGLEVTMGTGGTGAMYGKFNDKLNFADLNAPAYTFDQATLDYHARATSKMGFNVRKADDILIRALKTAGVWDLLLGLCLHRSMGAADARLNAKNSAYDLVDETGTLRYIAGQGITYNNASGTPTGCGTFNYIPANDSANWSSTDAFMGVFIEQDLSTASSFWFGNARSAIGRGGGAGGLKHMINNTNVTFGGGNASVYIPTLFSIRRKAGTTPEGLTIGGVVEYEVKQSGSTNALYNTGGGNTSVPGTAPVVGDGPFRLGSNDKTTLSAPVVSLTAWGKGMTKTQVDAFNSAVMTWRATLAAMGL